MATESGGVAGAAETDCFTHLEEAEACDDVADVGSAGGPVVQSE